MPFDPQILDRFPSQPGVYVMRDAAGEVLYVGKAINLRQRVKHYFSERGDGRPMVPFLVAKVDTIETVVVTSEKEALLLENTLIKEHQPPYNALLKDDKTYISLKVRTKHQWPTVEVVRYRGGGRQDGVYFGPYTGAGRARQTLELLQRLFPMRQCSDEELVRRDRPCILYQMKRCLAPCVGYCTKAEYDGVVQRAIRFLRGYNEEVLAQLMQAMEKASEAWDYERAGEILRDIRVLEKTIEKQQVARHSSKDRDVWALFREGDEVVATLLVFRHGKLLGSTHHTFSGLLQEDGELLHSLLLQHYERQKACPHEVLVPLPLPAGEALAELLSVECPHQVKIIAPKRGDGVRMVEMAAANAEAAFRQQKDVQTIQARRLTELQETLHLNHYPGHIECLDTAHHGGAASVAVSVTYTDGKKDKGRYRTYLLRETAPGDDYGALREVLKRRYRRAKDENNLPNLLVIDGGLGQLNVAIQCLEELDIASVDVIALAKEKGRHDKGMTAERVFVPNRREPIQLERTSPVLFLLQEIRDEAHRFALMTHRRKRTKETIRSELTEIPGIGRKKCQRLIKHFGSVKKIKEASPEELSLVKGISKKDVDAILKHFA